VVTSEIVLKIPLARITSGLKPTPSSAIVRPKFDRQRSERLDHVFADAAGRWLVAAFEINADELPQRLVIWKDSIREV